MIFDTDTQLRELEYPNKIGGIEHEKPLGVGSFETPNVLIVGNDKKQNTTVAKTIIHGSRGK